jgi:hypothetical protein
MRVASGAVAGQACDLPRTPAKNTESIAMLERALALDQTSAEAMISLADQILLPIFQFYDFTTRALAKLRTHGASSWFSKSKWVRCPLHDGCVTP